MLTLVNDLSLSLADTAATPKLYDDIIYELGQLPVLIECATLDVTLEQTSFTLPDDAIELLDVFYDDMHLDRIRLLDLESLNESWRDETGIPIAYVQENENERTFRLYPKPSQPSKPYNFLLGLPLAAGYPAYTVLACYTRYSETLPFWLELPVTFELLSREFRRESEHKDFNYAQVASKLAQVLFKMLQAR